MADVLSKYQLNKLWERDHVLLCYTGYDAEATRHLVTGSAADLRQLIYENRKLVGGLTLKAFGCGYDVKGEGQDAQYHTNRGDVVVAVLFGDALTVHALAQ